jgi:hypothetical protein
MTKHEKPGFLHKRVLHLEPSRASTTISGIVLTLLALAVVVGAANYPAIWPRPNPPVIDDRTLSITAAVAGFFALIFVLVVISNGRRWRTARAIVRRSNDPRWAGYIPPQPSLQPTMTSSTIPPLAFRLDRPRKYARRQAELRRVSPERNVVGDPPLHILYLRLFENQPRMRTFIEGAWREFGFVYMLRTATSVTPRELRLAKRHKTPDALFIDSPERLWGYCNSCGYRPLPKGHYTFKNIAPTTIRVRDKYGGYPARAMLCHGLFWQSAISTLLTKVNLVAMDLSGFTVANEGTRFELQRIVDTFPIERVVFLVDKYSNKGFIEAQISEAWREMAAGSPNATPGTRIAVLAETDYFVQMQQQQGNNTRVYVQLKSRRSQTRQVALEAQNRVR